MPYMHVYLIYIHCSYMVSLVFLAIKFCVSLQASCCGFADKCYESDYSQT